MMWYDDNNDGDSFSLTNILDIQWMTLDAIKGDSASAPVVVVVVVVVVVCVCVCVNIVIL